MSLKIGIDVGSTTVKVVAVENGRIIFSRYERHGSKTREKAAQLLKAARDAVGDVPVCAALSGSAGLGLSRRADIPFIQEVYAAGEAVRAMTPDADVVIELGGEDAKIMFLNNPQEERMNGSCAGGTGAFIDQMATLLNVTVPELDELSGSATTIYPIASRCGVFAKSDIQPLINQGARREDIAASIFQAVVDQTVTGLAQGRAITGRVVFLGGSLHFCKGLRRRFMKTLGLDAKTAIFPEFSLYAVALGAAMCAPFAPVTLGELASRVSQKSSTKSHGLNMEPLFANEGEYEEFKLRHGKSAVERIPIEQGSGRAYLGVDCGSTTTKLVLIDDEGRILYDFYSPNLGNPVDLVKEQLIKIRSLCPPALTIAGASATGYGEELIKNAFSMDEGIVETTAHLTAARVFNPDVDFLLDIGGQDIKCFKIRKGTIDSIMLNEACSSGCGSFVETFAHSLGYEVEEFTRLGLLASHPCDLGSRCTVFMNSSIKQAQKDGAGIDDISAGLSVSVVKNAVYKVIRAYDPRELGENIVVQGGTFLNDAVLRAFEREIGRNVIRPAIAGLMGAYGCALHARSLGLKKSTLTGADELLAFTHSALPVTCKNCQNRCRLTVNTFGQFRRYISGNRCERPLGHEPSDLPNIYEYKRKRIEALKGIPGRRGKIGLPMGLNMFENIPFFHAFFTALSFETVISGMSTPKTCAKGRGSVASDTVCYPAKLVHGHVEELLEQGIDTLFYPCMSYNMDEKRGDNHYNCPVVAYYPELLKANMESLSSVRFLYPYITMDDERRFVASIYKHLKAAYPDIRRGEVKEAARFAYEAYYRWQRELVEKGEEMLSYARENGLKTVVLAGRPYHIDPEINHGIDGLLTSLGFVVVSEDCVCDKVGAPMRTKVLNQWTYHSRLYGAARYVCENSDTELVQLVSFGCGLDAITTDEVRDVLEGCGKIYTQLKIDDINNLGAMKIRLRSLKAAVEEKDRSGSPATEQEVS